MATQTDSIVFVSTRPESSVYSGSSNLKLGAQVATVSGKTIVAVAYNGITNTQSASSVVKIGTGALELSAGSAYDGQTMYAYCEDRTAVPFVVNIAAAGGVQTLTAAAVSLWTPNEVRLRRQEII
jgi:hypothetical protein